jgi:hypothetical protein
MDEREPIAPKLPVAFADNEDVDELDPLNL